MSPLRPEDNIVRGQLIPFYATLGFQCWPTSARVHAKGVRPGIADIYVMAPRYGFAFWHEAKRPTTDKGWRRQSQEQRNFQEQCQAARIAYVLGDLESAYDFAEWLGVGQRLPNGFKRFAELTRMSPLRVIAAATPWNRTRMAEQHNATWGWRPGRGTLPVAHSLPGGTHAV